MLDLNDVGTFVQVVKAGSFAAAGRKLGVPANTLSRRVQLLENALGTRLLLRSTRKLNLTTAGARFYALCADSISDLEHAGASLLETSSQPAGTVRATAPVDFFNHFPMAWIAEFMVQHPRVQVEFLLNDRQLNLVEESIDVAFRSGRLEGASLVARKLASNVRGLFASPQFLTQHGVPTKVEDLSRMECITSPTLSGRVVWRLSGQQGDVDVTVSGQFRADTAQAQTHAARAGLGIALLPTTLVARDHAAGKLVRVLPEYWHDIGGFYAVTSTHRLRSPAVSALIEFVAVRLQDLLAGVGVTED